MDRAIYHHTLAFGSRLHLGVVFREFRHDEYAALACDSKLRIRQDRSGSGSRATSEPRGDICSIVGRFFSLPVLASQLVRLRHIACWFKMSTSRRSHRARGRSMPDERGRSADSASDGGRGAFEHASEGEYGANEGEAGQSYEQGFNGRTLCALGWLVLLLSCTMVCIPS